MSFAMVITHCVRIVSQISRNEVQYLLISISGCSRIQLDPLCRQCVSCAAANASADQYIYSACLQEACQHTVALSCCRYDLRGNDLTVFYIINFKRFCMSEVLEHITVFISYCYFHFAASFCCPFLSYQGAIICFPPDYVKY
jgi:hypothetical protein